MRFVRRFCLWWPDPKNGTWVVSPDYLCQAPSVSVAHIETIFRVVGFSTAFDKTPLAPMLNYHPLTLNLFKGFCVNEQPILSITNASPP